MLTNIHIERYKSLYDVTIDLESLTVLIGPNASGKSNICEAIYFLSKLIQHIEEQPKREGMSVPLSTLSQIIHDANLGQSSISSKFWRGEKAVMRFEINTTGTRKGEFPVLSFPSEFVALPLQRELVSALDNVKIYDFNPQSISSEQDASVAMSRSGQGVAYVLADILFESRDRFSELESHLMALIPTVGGISLERNSQNRYSLGLKDRFSKYVIPAPDLSDGTLRILALLAALYETSAPDIICIEEPENGIHPWLLHKIIELLNRISQDGIGGHPVQFILTTHSVALLNYLKPEQIRAVELDREGRTVVHKLPVDNQRFQKALDTFDGELGELWFTDMFGGNPR